MSAQRSYRFNAPLGTAGGIVDLAPYAIDTFTNEENTGVMHFGFGVVKGTNAGVGVKLPSAITDVFEGVAINNRTTEYDMDGNVRITKDAALGVMRYGRVYVCIASGLTVAYGDSVYLICTGNDKGKFTNTPGDNTLLVDAKFVKVEGEIAAIDLHKVGPVVVDTDTNTVYSLPNASADVLGGVKVGTGLTIDENGVLSVNNL